MAQRYARRSGGIPCRRGRRGLEGYYLFFLFLGSPTFSGEQSSKAQTDVPAQRRRSRCHSLTWWGCPSISYRDNDLCRPFKPISGSVSDPYCKSHTSAITNALQARSFHPYTVYGNHFTFRRHTLLHRSNTARHHNR